MNEPSPSDDSTRTLRLALAVSVVATAAIFMLPVPLGVPGEWTWDRRPISLGRTGWLAVGVVVAAAYAFAVDRLSSRLAETRQQRAVSLGLLFVASIAVMVALPLTVRDATGSPRAPFVLATPAFSGYFTEARAIDGGTLAFLQNYESIAAEGDYLHQGTHPPGLILLYRTAFAAVRSVPGLRGLLENTRLFSTDIAMVTMSEIYGSMNLGPDDFAVLQLVDWITLVAAAVCGSLIMLLLRPLMPFDRAIRWAGAWPLVPALAVFHPKSDLLLPLFPLAVAVCWLRANREQSVTAAAISGCVAFVGLILSLAVLPAYAGVLVASLAAWSRRPPVRLLVAGAAGVVVPILLLAIAGVNMPAIWRLNLANHAAFYDHSPRTYLAWLPVNLVEGAVAIGLPLFVAAAVSRAWQWTCETRTIAGVLAAWTLLWLSGKNMGEAARLWIVLDPWAVLTVAAASAGMSRRNLRTVLVAAAMTSAITVHSVDGFNFSLFQGGR